MMMSVVHLLLFICCALMLLQASAAKLAFLVMPPRHNHHHRCQTSFSTRHGRNNLPRLCKTRLKASRGSSGGDDDSICDVYQQVKDDDSEWYSKISQMLENEELLDTTIICGDDNKETELNTKEEANGKFNQVKEETSKQVIYNSLVGDDQSSKEDANNDVVSTKADTTKETSKPETPTDNLIDDNVDESSRIQKESVEIPVVARHSEGHYTQFLDDDDEDVEDFREERSNKETKSKVESSEATNNDDIRAQQNHQVDDEGVTPKQSPPPTPIVRIYNEFTKQHENIAPLSALEKLGYNQKELQLLRPQVLELIVDDRIPRPRRGIPKRWVKSMDDDQYDEEEERSDEDFGWQVQVISPKKPTKSENTRRQNNEQRVTVSKEDTTDAVSEDRIDNQKDVTPTTRRSTNSREDEPFSRVKDASSRATSGGTIGNKPSEIDNELNQPRRQQQQQQQSSSEYEQDFRRERGYRPPPQRRKQPLSERNDGYDERANARQPRHQRRNNRRQRTPKRQELLIDRESYGDDPSGNKFWMDLPMFKDFLRKEAQFRLKILGPDWKESVLDESRWRYDLYKTWLQMVDDGVGENPLYTYSDRPRRRRSRPERDAKYEREIDTRAAPGRRAPRSQKDIKQRRTLDDSDDYDYDYEERKSKRESDDADDVEQRRRRTQMPEQARNEQPPKRRSRSSQPPINERWTNFNDLEESLLSSSQRRPDSYDDEIPRRRRRRRRSDVYEEVSDEDETPKQRYSTDDYVDALEEDGRQPQRRRSRARRDISYEQLDGDEI